MFRSSGFETKLTEQSVLLSGVRQEHKVVQNERKTRVNEVN